MLLASERVVMFLNESPSHSVSERVPFQALWVEFHLQSNVICEVNIIPLMRFLKLTLAEEALERYNNYGKPIYMMDDFSINPLTNETYKLSKDILISLQCNSCVPIIDKPTWVYDTVISFYNKFFSQIFIE